MIRPSFVIALILGLFLGFLVLALVLGNNTRSRVERLKSSIGLKSDTIQRLNSVEQGMRDIAGSSNHYWIVIGECGDHMAVCVISNNTAHLVFASRANVIIREEQP